MERGRNSSWGRMGGWRRWASAGAWPVLLGLLLLCVGVGGLQACSSQRVASEIA